MQFSKKKKNLKDNRMNRFPNHAPGKEKSALQAVECKI
jgi:hypothetical protein